MEIKCIDNIKGKRILFFCTNFKNYYKEIINSLFDQGADVVKYYEIPNFLGSFRAVNKYNSNPLKCGLVCYYYLKNPFFRSQWSCKVLSELKGERFDVVFCVGDVPFTSFFIDEIRKANDGLKTYLFLWDKLDVRRVPKRIIKMFDYKFSFDRDDCKLVENLQYLPDFYIENKTTKEIEQKYDVSFIGTLSEKQRGTVIKELNRFCLENELTSFLYLAILPRKYNTTKNFLKLLYRKYILDRKYKSLVKDVENEDFLKTEYISVEEVLQIQDSSSCIVDISYRGRQGLTLNAIAALAQGKKLLTANNRIKEEAFFDPTRIFVFDSAKPHFEIDFFKQPGKPIDLSYLRLDNWLKYILNR